MKKFVVFVLLIYLAGCATQGSVGTLTGAQINDGEQVLADLQRLYSATPTHCGSDSTPAFLCSGILIRGASYSPDYHSWDPSPNQLQKGGVSFSYIRRDSKYVMGSAFVAGYVIYPEFERPTAKIQLMVECFFPMDGWTDFGRRDHGCGPSSSYADSGRCNTLSPPVTTAAQWVAHYRRVAVNPGLHACAFSVPDSANQLAGPAFNQGLASMALLNSQYQNASFNEWNEMMVDVWAPGLGHSLPIKAFWYRTNGATNGLAGGQRMQHDFLCSSQGGRVLVPLIRVMPPRVIGEDFIFQYNTADQSTAPCT